MVSGRFTACRRRRNGKILARHPGAEVIVGCDIQSCLASTPEVPKNPWKYVSKGRRSG